MPRIPDETALGQRPTLRSRDVVPITLGREEQAEMEVSQAVSAAGRTVLDISNRIQERKDRRQIVEKKSEFLQNLIANETQFEGDTEYQTFGKRFYEDAQEAKKKALEGIDSPSLRAQFEADADLDIQRGIARMAKKSWQMEKNDGVAAMGRTIANNRELYLSADDGAYRNSILSNTQNAIEMARVNGYISPEQAEEMSRAAGQEYAEAYISMQPAKEQIRMLKSGEAAAELIPADRRKALLEKVDMRGASQEAADEIVASGVSDQEMVKRAKEIDDPVIRDETLTRIKSHINTRDAIERQTQQQAFEEAKGILVEADSLDSIPPETWKTLNGGQKLQLRDYVETRAAKAAQGRKSDNYDVLDEVDQRIESGDITDPAQLAIYEPYLRDATIRAKRKQIQKRGEVSGAEMRRAFEDRIGKTRAKWGDADREQWIAFQDYVANNIQETRRPEDLDHWADKWFMEGYSTQGSRIAAFFGAGPDTFGEALTEGRTDFLVPVKDTDAQDVDDALDILRSAGQEIPKNKTARDEFYTQFYLDGTRFMNAQDYPVTPSSMAAYAILKQAGKPLTLENLRYVESQL